MSNGEPSIVDADDAVLRGLIPVELIEPVVGPLKLRVLRTRKEIQAHDLAASNTATFTEAHYRFLGIRAKQEKLERAYNVLKRGDARDLEERLDLKHHQVVVYGDTSTGRAIDLHVARIYPRSLHIADVELARPGVPARRPMGPDQEWEGVGRGAFTELMNRLARLAEELGFDALTAHAADDVRAEVFRRKAGFAIDHRDPNLVEQSELNGLQIPLIRPLR